MAGHCGQDQLERALQGVFRKCSVRSRRRAVNGGFPVSMYRFYPRCCPGVRKPPVETGGSAVEWMQRQLWCCPLASTRGLLKLAVSGSAAAESPRWKPGDQRLSGCSVSCGAVRSLPLAACRRRVRCGSHAIAKKPPMKTSGIAVEIDINRGPRASNLTDAGSGTLFFGRKMVDPCW